MKYQAFLHHFGSMGGWLEGSWAGWVVVGWVSGGLGGWWWDRWQVGWVVTWAGDGGVGLGAVGFRGGGVGGKR